MINTTEERSRIELAESVTIPRDEYIDILDEIERLRTLLGKALPLLCKAATGEQDRLACLALAARIEDDLKGESSDGQGS